MRKSITPNQIKENNRRLIYQYIYKNEKVSQQDIAYDLHLSRPTVTTNLAALEEEGLIRKCGQIDTEYVGRKASAYAIVSDYRIGIGVEILEKEVMMIAVDLYGEKIQHQTFEITYEDKEEYFHRVCDEVLNFKSSVGVKDEQILGVGFAMQGLVSPDRKTVIYGQILAGTGLSITSFTKYLPFPCSFIHDADSAAIAELWVSPELENAFFLSLSRHLGASIIAKRELLSGKHGHSAMIEHIQMEAEGKRCYCGKQGCMDTVCSIHALLEKGETLASFFEKLKNQDHLVNVRWHRYLDYLAKAIYMLHLVYDTDFILGGYLTPYLREQDLSYLYEEIRKMTPFKETQDFLQISKMPQYNITIGAALPYIEAFLNSY